MKGQATMVDVPEPNGYGVQMQTERNEAYAKFHKAETTIQSLRAEMKEQARYYEGVLTEREAEIVRLTEINRVLVHDFNTMLLANSKLQDEITRSQAPSGASAMERAERIISGKIWPGSHLRDRVKVSAAAEIGQAKADARAQAFEDAAQECDVEATRCKSMERPPWTPELQRAGRVTAEAIARRIRTLAAKSQDSS